MAKKSNQEKKIVKKPTQKSVQQETTNLPSQTDRVLRSGPATKNAACPECNAFPTITKIRRKDYELRRCRECGHRFEIKKGGE